MFQFGVSDKCIELLESASLDYLSVKVAVRRLKGAHLQKLFQS